MRKTLLYRIFIASCLVFLASPSFAKPGEKITYSVKLGVVSLGTAYFNYLENSSLSGKPVAVISFTTKVTGFQDIEMIYADLSTMLPLKIERKINNMGSRERITENYDQKRSMLAITKIKGNKKEQFDIKKDGNIQNAILLPFSVRREPRLDIGWGSRVRLPTQDFSIKLVSIEDVSVPAGKFKAYHFVSEPEKIEIWITADERRIPVKIKGAASIGYVMYMREYHQ